MIVIEMPINYLVDYLIWHGKQFSTNLFNFAFTKIRNDQTFNSPFSLFGTVKVNGIKKN
jgi:hypothetical protein